MTYSAKIFCATCNFCKIRPKMPFLVCAFISKLALFQMLNDRLANNGCAHQTFEEILCKAISIIAHCQLHSLQYLLVGRVQQSLFERIASQHDWFIPRNIRRGVLETRVSMNSSAKHCQLAFLSTKFSAMHAARSCQQSPFGRISCKHYWNNL